ncbi:MAG: type III-B CRISPR-associated protein Cas10/Cmr2 [Motiliproteus sp.]
MSDTVFQMTLGPVQGFVAQARRTRDFWAGSFLLSWLSGVAMTDVINQGGEIDFPSPDGDFMAAIRGELEDVSLAPLQGSIPNRFKAIHAKVPLDFNPEQVIESFNVAWQTLAQLVWDELMVAVMADQSSEQQEITRLIWQRQVNGFWEVNWCLSEAGQPSKDLLNRRKNFRDHQLSSEPGVKCMMMDGFQELSGASRPNAKALTVFWSAMGQHITSSDLRSGEHLCALAVIKRVFARFFHQLEQPMQGWNLRGWDLPTTVPSTSYLAAAHWIEQAIVKANKTEIEDAWQQFFLVGKSLSGGLNEYNSRLKCLTDIASGEARNWVGLDGNLYFPHLLDNANLYHDRETAEAVSRALSQLRKATGLPEPSPFYAVLMMDGDGLGVQMGSQSKQQSISSGLKRFNRDVIDIVEQHSGFLVYAGGDDVLAMLPLEDALHCASALRDCYDAIFEEENRKLIDPVKTSISAAVLFSHIKQPLTTTLQRAHQLLDSVAKQATGRDSLAVEVWKPGGRHLQWAMPWSICADAGQPPFLATMAKDWQDQKSISMSQGFLQRAIAVLDRLMTPDIDEDICYALLQAEYRHSMKKDSGGARRVDVESEQALLSRLLQQSQIYIRQPLGDCVVESGYQTGGLKLLRFLSQKGV